MEEATKKEAKKKGFFTKLMEKLDKKLEAKAKKTGCGCGPRKEEDDSCCG